MNPAYLQISNSGMILAASLILINVLISLWLRLNLATQWLWASIRMTVQLFLIGYLLAWVFSLNHPWVVFSMAMFMALVAAQSVVSRLTRRFPAVFLNSLMCILLSSFFVTGISTQWIVQVSPWYQSQYFIPLLGMVMGNTLTGISLALERFMENLALKQNEIETQLSLGATRWEAAHGEIKATLLMGLVPTLNGMLVTGLVSLPGMMTGQMLGGVAPLAAIRYQIVIMFMIAAGTALGTLGILWLAFLNLFSTDHRLLLERLQKVQKKK